MNDDKPKGSSHDTSQETTDFASHLVFASHLDIQDYTGHQDYQPPTLTTDYLARLLNWKPISYTLPHIPFGIKPDYSSIWSSTTTFMYNPVLSVVRIDAKHSWQPDRCQYHESILISVCRIHCFMQYTPNLLKLFYPTLLPLFHRNNTHPPL